MAKRNNNMNDSLTKWLSSVSPSCLPKTNISNIINTNVPTPTTTTININVTTTSIVSTIKPVANLDCNANIRNVFDVLGKDLDFLADLNMEHTDLMEHNRLEEIRQMLLNKLVQYILSASNEFKNISILLARVIAAKTSQR